MIWLRSIHHLAAAIASFINAFDPEIVIIGGGIAQAGRRCLIRFVKNWIDLSGGHWAITVQVIPAALGEKAGAIGAAYHAIHARRHEALIPLLSFTFVRKSGKTIHRLRRFFISSVSLWISTRC